MIMNIKMIAKCAAALSLSGILFCSIVTAREVESIPSRGQSYVSDFAGLLSPTDKTAITRYASELEKKTTAQIAVVTMGSTQPENIQAFSVRLFDQWKIGQQGKDNGVLLLVAVNDRKAWITTGYGLEGAIPDVIANKIVQKTMLPDFRQGKFSTGITKGAVSIISLVAKEYDVTITGQETQVYQTVHRGKSGFEIILTILIFIFIFGMRTGLLGYLFMGSMLGGRRRGGYWHGSGTGGSSGGFSGGFGGFGGGMTGGGGGGGGW